MKDQWDSSVTWENPKQDAAAESAKTECKGDRPAPIRLHDLTVNTLLAMEGSSFEELFLETFTRHDDLWGSALVVKVDDAGMIRGAYKVSIHEDFDLLAPNDLVVAIFWHGMSRPVECGPSCWDDPESEGCDASIILRCPECPYWPSECAILQGLRSKMRRRIADGIGRIPAHLRGREDITNERQADIPVTPAKYRGGQANG